MSIPPPTLTNIRADLHYIPKPVDYNDRLYIFGRNPVLSVGELISLYHQKQRRAQFKALCERGAIVEGEKDISLNKAGSLLRKVKILGAITSSLQHFEQNFKNLAEELLYNEVFMEEKSSWTISQYNFPDNFDVELLESKAHILLKKTIKKLRIKRAYYIQGHERQNVSPRRLKRKAVLKHGVEVVFFFWQNEIIVGFTQEVINIDNFNLRDKNRPHTRPLLLLGLAIARTMVNLIFLGSHFDQMAIYDPFCGMGSILSEAYCLGFPIYGSDIDAQCVKQTQANLNWLWKQKDLHSRETPPEIDHIFQMDITNPDPDFSTNFYGAVVTEPNLLTPMKNYPTIEEARQIMHQFEENYFEYFRGLIKILHSGQIGVIIFPRIHTQHDDRLAFDYDALLAQFDCEIVQAPLNNVFFRGIFVHAWKKHIIEREIVVFQKL